MAFVSNMDNEQQNQPGGPVAPGGASNTIQTQPGAGVGAAGASATPGASNATPGGGFASLNQYVNANQGQAAPLAGKITSGINDQYNTLQGQNQQTLQGIQGQVDQGYTKQNADILAQESANPVSFASNPTNIQNFQSQLNDQYTGPANAEGQGAFQTQLGNVNTAIQQGQAQTQTAAGRNQLLQQNEAAPSNAVTGLNSAILASDPNSQKSIEQAYNPFQNLVSGLNTGAQGIDTNIGNATTEAANASSAANQAIANQQNTLNQAVQGQFNTAETGLQNYNDEITKAFQNAYGGVAADTTPTTLGTYGGGTTPWANTTNYTVSPFAPNIQQDLGINTDQATALQNAMQQGATTTKYMGNNFGANSPTAQLDLSKFLTLQNPNALTTANTATPEQYAQQHAFQSLLGSLPQGAVLDPTQAAMAGTAPSTKAQFDYANALKTAQDTAAAEKLAGQQEAYNLTQSANEQHAAADNSGLGGFMKSNPAFGTLAKYFANPLLAVPQEKQLAQKVI